MHNWIAQKIKFALLGLAVLALGSCSDSPAPLRVGTNIWIGYEPFYIARELGYYRDNTIKLLEMNNATEVSSALRAGLLDAAALTLDEALVIKQDLPDLRIALVMDSSAGADVLLGKSNIHSLPELKGKRIGVETTAVGAILLQAALDAAQLTAQDVEIVSLSVDEHTDAFESGRVDAVVTFDPVRTRLLQSGAKTLFDSRAIPNRIIDVLVVRGTDAKEHKKQLRKLIEGHFSALDYLKQQPEKALRLMSTRLRAEPAQIADMLNGVHIQDRQENLSLLSGTPSPLDQQAGKLVRLMQDQRMLAKSVDLNHFSDPQWLKPN